MMWFGLLEGLQRIVDFLYEIHTMVSIQFTGILSSLKSFLCWELLKYVKSLNVIVLLNCLY